MKLSNCNHIQGHVADQNYIELTLHNLCQNFSQKIRYLKIKIFLVFGDQWKILPFISFLQIKLCDTHYKPF